jgi:glucosamine-6-phosphate deaminase
MKIHILPDRTACGVAAAARGSALLRQALSDRGEANIIVATGASQFDMFDALVAAHDVAWEKVTIFHLDEYVGLPITHPASFRRYLWERFHRRLPRPPRAFHYVDGEQDPQETCDRLGTAIAQAPIDVCFAGIGENGHLAFNDPPADFETETPYLVVELDEACRRQQLGEGWFPSLEAVPTRAISMSVRQILKSNALVVTVPDERKAEAVRAAIEGPVTNHVPASILQRHGAAWLYLDEASASRLTRTSRPA